MTLLWPLLLFIFIIIIFVFSECEERFGGLCWNIDDLREKMCKIKKKTERKDVTWTKEVDVV